MSPTERRKYARIPVSIPISCVSIDSEGTPLNFNMGVVKNVSQNGIALESVSQVNSELLLLSFVDTNHKTLEIKGKVMRISDMGSGRCKVGVLLLGTPQENVEFVKHLVRFYHYTKKVSSTLN